MIYTKQIHTAIQFAIKVHEIDTKKKRKGKDVPYVTHPLTVGLILARVTEDKNTFKCLNGGQIPERAEECDYCRYVEAVKKNINMLPKL